MERNKIRRKPVLYMVLPCYNEQEVLPITASLFLDKLQALISEGKISASSRILFVNDGSEDSTWTIIKSLAEQNDYYTGISQSRNRGHQSTLLAGLMEAKDRCDITISMDCDGQDDIDAVDEMIGQYLAGYEVVYGVRCNRKSDSLWKRFTAETYYKLLIKMGIESIFNHADYRLVSARVLQELANYHEVNLYLRGMLPLIGFPSTNVFYERKTRIAGTSHYSFASLRLLALDGITSLSIKPIRMIRGLGALIASLSAAISLWFIALAVLGHAISGWKCLMCAICFFGGMNLLALGILGEYVGKTYFEAKGRPRYIISERTYEKDA